MAGNEAGCSGLCGTMFDLSSGQDRALKVGRVTSAARDPRVEMGRYYDGFHCGIAEDSGPV